MIIFRTHQKGCRNVLYTIIPFIHTCTHAVIVAIPITLPTTPNCQKLDWLRFVHQRYWLLFVLKWELRRDEKATRYASCVITNLIDLCIVLFCAILSGSPKRFGHSFYGILIPTYVHARHTGYLPNPSTQFLIARCNDETSPLLCHARQTVIGIPLLFAIARNSLEAWVLCQSQCNLVFSTQFFEFCHDTVRNAGYTFGQ